MIRLRTERLLLREFEPSDWEGVHRFACDPAFTQYLTWLPHSSPDQSREYVAKRIAEAHARPREIYRLATCLAADGTLIGQCGIRPELPGSTTAKLGWGIAPRFQNHGYASEAAGALLRYGFEELGYAVIAATCDPRNVASARVMQKLGMSKVGILIAEREVRGVMRDTLRLEARAGEILRPALTP